MLNEDELEIFLEDASGDYDSLSIPRIESSNYSVFFNKFMSKNRPCIVSSVTSSWPCARLWVCEENVNYDYLETQYGELSARVSNCDDTDCEPSEKTVAEYLQYLRGSDGSRSRGICLYLKDWHLRRCRTDDDFYRVPKLFASDWLNEYCLDNDLDDFMFVYMGPKGSWTPLHADVYSSFSWSVNVTGLKRWVIIPPGEEQKIVSRGQLPQSIEPGPGLRYTEVLQYPGDAIFVPSGWHHVVYNEQDTISVNHNWINGCNVAIVWKNLQLSLSRVEKELDDIKTEPSFQEDCQKVLKCDHGMNYEQFVEFLLYIGTKRVKEKCGEISSSLWGFRLGCRHLQFDLIALDRVISSILNDSLVAKVVQTNKFDQLIELRHEIARNVSSEISSEIYKIIQST